MVEGEIGPMERSTGCGRTRCEARQSLPARYRPQAAPAWNRSALLSAFFAAPTWAWRKGSFHINDNAELHVDEIVVGVSEECRSLVSAGPLGRRIGWRDELRHNVAGGAPRRIVESRQILLHRAAGPRWIAVLAPILTSDRALLVGIGRNQARIDGKAFTANQTGRNAPLDDPFEHVAKYVSLAERSLRASENAK